VRDFIYGKPPAEQLQEWQRTIKKEQRQLDKEIRDVRSSPLLWLCVCAVPDELVVVLSALLFTPADALPFTQISAAQQKTRTELKQLAKRNDVKSARILAREVVRSNKQVDRLHVSKARLNSVGMQLTHQAGASSPLRCPVPRPRANLASDHVFPAMLKVTGSMQKSTEVMKLTNELVKLPQLNAAMRQMSMEMMKVRLLALPSSSHPAFPSAQN
jgi:charged multivesicular body protein 3